MASTENIIEQLATPTLATQTYTIICGVKERKSTIAECFLI